MFFLWPAPYMLFFPPLVAALFFELQILRSMQLSFTLRGMEETSEVLVRLIWLLVFARVSSGRQVRCMLSVADAVFV